MKTASGFITHITLLALAASALLSCTGNRGAEVRLQRAEDIMNERGGAPAFLLHMGKALHKFQQSVQGQQ